MVVAMQSSWLFALLGGALIGSAAALLMHTHGRVAGISGVLGALLPPRPARDRGWRLAFLIGLVVPGAIAALVAPAAVGAMVRPLGLVAVAGVVVGVGTQLGSGCTSGHGVCGLARLSPRSLAAVVTFMATGALTAMAVRGLA